MSLSVFSDAPVRVIDIKDSIDLESVIVALCPAFSFSKLAVTGVRWIHRG